jgi:S-adenosylmethionine-diacylglycerol 3-amino-3-carboxypropyl transferase
MSINNRIFSKIHSSSLVYNTCWEDPRCDRAMLGINKQSKIVMLTSAGCNALDYLLDGAERIDCVDMNAKQNALLDLKLALFKSGNKDALYGFFGDGKYKEAREVLEEDVKHLLPDYALRFWQKHITSFSGTGMRKSFYYHGSSGIVAYFLKTFLETNPSTKHKVNQMFEADTIEQQAQLYYAIEPKLLNRFIAFILDLHLVQSMVGVPKSQQDLARRSFPDGMTGYFKYCFRKVFAEQSLKDNYFWKLYFKGHYDRDCCPHYLMPENYHDLSKSVHQIHTHTSTLSEFLRNAPGKYTHFVLLDHQDWLAANNKPALQEEWDLIFANSAPGAKILLRSAAFNRDFIPQEVQNKVCFDDNLVQNVQLTDRVGTYASTHFGVLN